MGDRDNELGRTGPGRGWVALGGASRTATLFWTSPQIRSFVPRNRDGADLLRLDVDARRDEPK
jgi:hypothetical protein